MFDKWIWVILWIESVLGWGTFMHKWNVWLNLKWNFLNLIWKLLEKLKKFQLILKFNTFK